MTVITPPSKHDALQQELEKKISSIQDEKIENETKKIAQKNSLPYIDLSSYPIDTNIVFLIEENEARRGQLAAVSKTGRTIMIALRDPNNIQAKNIIENLKGLGYEISQAIVSEPSLIIAWQRYTLKKKAIAKNEGIIDIDTIPKDIREKIKSFADLKNNVISIPTSQIVEALIAGALEIGASDVHFEPQENTLRLRYRLDGVLQDIVEISNDIYDQILSRIKLLSSIKLNVHNIPQDGRFTIREHASDLEVRVSILPGAYCEQIVLRILDPESINKDLENLGMRPDTLLIINRLLKKTTGAILTTGPTGSGKTTTLYAFIKKINEQGIKIITIEDPVEYHINGIVQTQVDEPAGYTFANGLRSIMRQDPDIILVGEIRDKETAEIGMQAALTGHLVFTTLHTNDASGTISRLIDLGVKPTSIAPALKATMAQRLVRRMCLKCVDKRQVDAKDFEIIKKYIDPIKEQLKVDISETMVISYPKGCGECHNSGYQGRVGVYEILEIDAEIEKLILTSPAISDIKDIAQRKGMITMLQDGLLKTIKGMTTVEEVLRVVGE